MMWNAGLWLCTLAPSADGIAHARPVSDYDQYTVIASSGSHGSILPSDTVTVGIGENQQFSISPDPGYYIDSVIVDGIRTDSTFSYTFTNVTADHLIRCTFAAYGESIVPWTFTNTGMNHTIILDTGIHSTVSGMPLVAGDYIGVFYDSGGAPACGGYALWNGDHAITVAAFGNELAFPALNGFATGEPFQWKVFRWQENRIYDASATYYLPDSANPLLTSTNTYVTNGISKLRSLVAGLQHQTLSLRNGWSIISSYITPESDILDTIFGPVIPDLIILKNGQGKTYIPSIPVNMIGTWDASEGYQLKMSDTSSVSFDGMASTPERTPIALPGGWSIIPYLRQSELSADSALAGITSALIIAKDQDGKVYFPSLSINGIGTLKPGQGYQVKLSAADTLVYPANTFLFAKHIIDRPVTVKSEFKPHYITNVRTDKNATIIFPKKAVEGILMKGDEVAVFSGNDLLVGSGMYDGSDFAVAAWGDDPTTPVKDGLKAGEQFTLRLWYRSSSCEEEVTSVGWSEGSGAYEADGINIVGKLEVDRPDVALPDHVTLYQNYPNPFNPVATIRYDLPARSEVSLKVYNLLGEVVATLAAGLEEPGYKSVEWNASGVSSGIYFCRLDIVSAREPGKTFTQTRKMVLMK